LNSSAAGALSRAVEIVFLEKPCAFPDLLGATFGVLVRPLAGFLGGLRFLDDFLDLVEIGFVLVVLRLVFLRLLLGLLRQLLRLGGELADLRFDGAERA
jgi:hypothetical protein